MSPSDFVVYFRRRLLQTTEPTSILTVDVRVYYTTGQTSLGSRRILFLWRGIGSSRPRDEDGALALIRVWRTYGIKRRRSGRGVRLRILERRNVFGCQKRTRGLSGVPRAQERKPLFRRVLGVWTVFVCSPPRRRERNAPDGESRFSRATDLKFTVE